MEKVYPAPDHRADEWRHILLNAIDLSVPNILNLEALIDKTTQNKEYEGEQTWK